MKIDELKQLIRQLIKEEVASEVASEVSKAMGKVLVEMVKEIKKPSKQELVESYEEPIPQSILKTNNPKLSSALAETAQNYRPLPRQETRGSMVELMEGGFEKIGKHEVVTDGQPTSKLDFLKQMVNESVQPVASVLDEAQPPVLQKLFKKDFRAILAKSREKNGGYSPNVSMG